MQRPRQTDQSIVVNSARRVINDFISTMLALTAAVKFANVN